MLGQGPPLEQGLHGRRLEGGEDLCLVVLGKRDLPPGEDVSMERVVDHPEYLQTLLCVQYLLTDGGLSSTRLGQGLGLVQALGV